MRIIAFIEDEEVIKKILKHLGLWDLEAWPPPKVKAPSLKISIDDSDSHVPFSTPSLTIQFLDICPADDFSRKSSIPKTCLGRKLGRWNQRPNRKEQESFWRKRNCGYIPSVFRAPKTSRYDPHTLK